MLEVMECPALKAKWTALPASELEKLPRGAASAIFRLSFRTETEIPVTLRVSAADRYRLYLNGAPVQAGPAKGDPWNHFYDPTPVTLQAGENVLLARVMLFAPLERTVARHMVNGPTSVLPKSREPLFWLECDTLPEMNTGTAKWQAVYDPATTVAPCPAAWQASTAEIYYGEKALPEWLTVGGAEWPEAQPLFASDVNRWGEISPLLVKERPIPSLYLKPLKPEKLQPARIGEETLSFVDGKASVPAGRKQCLEIGFDALYTAFIRLKVLNGHGRIRVIYSENYYRPDGTKGLRDDASGFLKGIEDCIMAAGEPLLWDSFWFRAFRYIRLEVEAETDLTLAFPEFTETDYPLVLRTKVTEAPEWVSRLWEISARTLNRCMHETYEDCPYYEQLQYTMDSRLEMLFTYSVSGDTRLPRRTLWDFHCSRLPDGMLQSRYPSQYPQVIPAFSLHWIFMLEEYYLETGDAALLRQYRSTVDGVLDYFDRHIGETGLTEHLGYWDFGDWTEAWDSRSGTPFAVDDGPCTMHNLVYVQALQTAARLASAMGRPALAEDYTSRADNVLRLVQALCWDKDRKLYRNGPSIPEYTQHAQVLAILTGLVSGAEATALMERTLDDSSLIPCSFPWLYNVARALEKTDLYGSRSDEVLWKAYRGMLEEHLTTVPERPFLCRSDCHAWSALLLHEFPRKWLGVTPAAPGWKEIRIAPVVCPGTVLSGEVCTQVGTVSVRLIPKESGLTLSFTAPAVPVTVELPDGRVFRFPDGGSHTVD